MQAPGWVFAEGGGGGGGAVFVGTQEYHEKHIFSHDTAYLAFRTKTKFKMLTGEKRQSCNNLT